jgi:hypothetical protein
MITSYSYALIPPVLFIALVVLYLAVRLVTAAWYRSKFEAEIQAAKRKLEEHNG